MDRVGAYEAKTHLPSLLSRVANGERITITKHGVPVAMLVPVTAGRAGRDRREVIQEVLAFREEHPLGDTSIRDMIKEGRRF